jgi:beta-lactamase class A
LKLLNECNFKDGLQKGLPAEVNVAHKFGEWGDTKSNIHELHETGIVYLNSNPYLVTIMTRGTNPKDLSLEIGKISRTIYDVFSKSPDL